MANPPDPITAPLTSASPKCGLCSEVTSNTLVRITKCQHIYCSICILTYLRRRRFCPICVPAKRKKKFHFLTYLHPVKLMNKFKKHKKKITSKHLQPLFKDLTIGHTNESSSATDDAARLIETPKRRTTVPKVKSFTPISVEKEVETHQSDLNNNLTESHAMRDKYERISELIIKHENIRQFVEQTIKQLTSQDTMTPAHKLNELDKLASFELTQNQTELTNESNALKSEIATYRELDSRLNTLIDTRNRQRDVLEKTESINQKFNQLAIEYGEQNQQLKQAYRTLIKRLASTRI